jgi:uncharacterized protein (DUF1499 family)
MKKLILVAVIVASSVSINASAGLFSGSQPENLGVSAEGRLAPLPLAPHAVGSQASEKNESAIAPLMLSGDKSSYMARLAAVVAGMPGAKVRKQDVNYLHIEYTSALLGFVDDVEFALQADGRRVDVRSSSRLGFYDFNANRDRIEKIRAAMQAGK